MTLASRELRRETAVAIMENYLEFDTRLASEAMKEIDLEIAERLMKEPEQSEENYE